MKNQSTDAGHRGGFSCSSDEGAVMALERRAETVRSLTSRQLTIRRSAAKVTKSFEIDKRQVYEAYKQVKANKGGAGIDRQTLQDFDADLENNLYQLWNRLSSGSYYPPAVKRVDIPKGSGGTRPLGIPTVSDRIAQTVVKRAIEPELERHFRADSYGYRPNKSAHQALGIVRQRCWKRPWVLDMDIKGFFDTIDHDLLLKAVDKHVKEAWQKLYSKRWLTAPVQHSDGGLEHRTRGTPQGGVISPLLANLFLHYVFDIWVEKHWPGIQFVRYADDIICHCRSESEARLLKGKLENRFRACGLVLHPEKTRIAYCKSVNHREDYPVTCFDFLGYTFRPEMVKNRQGQWMLSFLPAIRRKALMGIYQTFKADLPKPQSGTIADCANTMNWKVTGWIHYYGHYNARRLRHGLFHLDTLLIQWIRKKYKRLKRRSLAVHWLKNVRRIHPGLFTHWQFIYQPVGR